MLLRTRRAGHAAAVPMWLYPRAGPRRAAGLDLRLRHDGARGDPVRRRARSRSGAWRSWSGRGARTAGRFRRRIPRRWRCHEETRDRHHRSVGRALSQRLRRWRTRRLSGRRRRATDGKLNIIAFGAHPGRLRSARGRHRGEVRRARPPRAVRRRHQRRRGTPDRRAAARWPRGGARKRRKPDAASASTTSSSTITTASCCRRWTSREQIIRQIRQWKADLVLAPRPNDYHPDHRYTGVLVQDAAYMVVGPERRAGHAGAAQESRSSCTSRTASRSPNPFTPGRRGVHRRRDREEDRHDGRARVADVRVAAVGRRQSRQVPEGRRRRARLAAARRARGQPTAAVRAALVKWYGPEKGSAVQHAEAFEICEYGARPDEALIRKLFPFLPKPNSRLAQGPRDGFDNSIVSARDRPALPASLEFGQIGQPGGTFHKAASGELRPEVLFRCCAWRSSRPSVCAISCQMTTARISTLRSA